MSKKTLTNSFACGAIAAIVLSASFVGPGYADEPQGGPTLHPGFENGVLLGSGVVQSSPVAEDIDMDGLPELIVGGNEGVLYAFNDDGSPVLDQTTKGEKGSIPPIGQLFATEDGEPILSSPTLFDIDSDRRVDVFFGDDAGKVYHLEVVLSTDSMQKRSRMAPQIRQSPIERFRRFVPSSQPEEDDDLRGR